MHYRLAGNDLTADIRVIDIDGEPWFPAKDVCDVLALRDPSQTVRRACKPEEQQQIAKASLNPLDARVSFPNRGMLCVNESGLYALIFKSRKAEAEAFRYWVTSEVLSLRRPMWVWPTSAAVAMRW